MGDWFKKLLDDAASVFIKMFLLMCLGFTLGVIFFFLWLFK